MSDDPKRKKMLLGAAAITALLLASCCCCTGVAGLALGDDLALTWNDALYDYVSSGSANAGVPFEASSFDGPIRRLSVACSGTGPFELVVVDTSVVASGTETVRGSCREWASSYHDLERPSGRIEVRVIAPQDRVEIAAYR